MFEFAVEVVEDKNAQFKAIEYLLQCYEQWYGSKPECDEEEVRKAPVSRSLPLQ